MMKLQIEELLDYLKAGASDPQIERRLKMDPDGSEMLRQAMLLYDMLGRLSASDEGDEDAEMFGTVASDARAAYSLADELPEPDMFDVSESDEVKPLSAKEIDSLSRLAQTAAGRIHGLGQLIFEIKGDRGSLSYVPDLSSLSWSTFEEIRASKKSFRFSDRDVMKLVPGEISAGTLQVRTEEFTISAPEHLTTRGVVSLAFTESRPAKPGRRHLWSSSVLAQL